MKVIIASVLGMVLLWQGVLTGKPAGPFGQCPEIDGAFPTYLPDLKCPQTFYECTAGSPKNQTCSADLIFVTASNVCEFPFSGREACGEIGLCPAEGEDLLRDGCNISAYYLCSNGTSELAHCEEGQAFDAFEGVCRKPSEKLKNEEIQ